MSRIHSASVDQLNKDLLTLERAVAHHATPPKDRAAFERTIAKIRSELEQRVRGINQFKALTSDHGVDGI
jgi:hypothetical protein